MCVVVLPGGRREIADRMSASSPKTETCLRRGECDFFGVLVWLIMDCKFSLFVVQSPFLGELRTCLVKL